MAVITASVAEVHIHTLRRFAYAVFLDDAACAFDGRHVTPIQEARLAFRDYVVELAIVEHAHFVRVCAGARVLVVELVGSVSPVVFGAAATQRQDYCEGQDLELTLAAATNGTAVRACVKTNIGRAAGWRAVGQPRDGEQAIALSHSHAAAGSPRTVVGVRVDPRHALPVLYVHSVHEHTSRRGVSVLASETRISVDGSPISG